MEKLITKSFRRLLDKGVHRGFITYEELGKSLGKRHYNQKNIEEAFLYIFDKKVSLVEKRSDYRLAKKKESALSDTEKVKETEKSDDPIRMYLREMGGVELLSREGEIAIAISPSRESNSTPPISLKYILIGSSLFSVSLTFSVSESADSFFLAKR